MKTKKKILKAVLPLMLLGTPAIAGSSIRSGSRKSGKKTVVQSTVSTQNIKEEKNDLNPFGSFSNTHHDYQMAENAEVEILSFLEEEGLLSSNKEETSLLSGDIQSDGCDMRKSFLDTNLTCVDGAFYNGNELARLLSQEGYGYQILSIDSNSGYSISRTKIQELIPVCNGSAKPIASSVAFTGTLDAGETLTGTYTYTDGENDPETGTTFQWYLSSDASGSDRIAILGATASTYVLSISDDAKFISFEVTPRDANNSGNPVESETALVSVSLSDSDSTLTVGATVIESSMIAIPSTADTLAEKVNVFDFRITDMGSGDGFSTDVSQLVVHTSGTADFSKMKWLLNGANVSNKEGVYSNEDNTITFSSLSISIADNSNENYILSAYFETPTGLTDNATFGFSIDGDTDVTVDTSKSGMATGQDAVTNNTNAKVDVTATKLIFTTQPSNEGFLLI